MPTLNLEDIARRANEHFSRTDRARERALTLHREVIRHSGLSIRAIHRGEFDEARRLVAKAGEVLDDIRQAIKDDLEVYYSGFVQDAQKEFAEANVTLALVTQETVPGPDVLKVDLAAYMNGMAEAVGELRRYILDSLRREDVATPAENYLQMMDEIYSILVTLDYPDGVTRGLRRSTDVARSIIEKTRGDLTSHLESRRLQEKLERFSRQVDGRS